MNTVFQYQKNISYPSYNIRMPIFQNYCSVLHTCLCVSHQSNLLFLSLPFPSVSCSLSPSPASPLLPALSSPLQNTVNVLGTSSCIWASYSTPALAKGFSFLNSVWYFATKAFVVSLLNIEPSLITFHLC